MRVLQAWAAALVPNEKVVLVFRKKVDVLNQPPRVEPAQQPRGDGAPLLPSKCPFSKEPVQYFS